MSCTKPQEWLCPQTNRSCYGCSYNTVDYQDGAVYQPNHHNDCGNIPYTKSLEQFTNEQLIDELKRRLDRQ